MNPFDFVKDIQQGKTNLMVDDLAEKEYIPFIVNKALSYHLDCVMFANEMNQRPLLDKKMQYGYLMQTVRSRKRPFQKWIKKEESDDIDTIRQTFDFSINKAKAALQILSPEQLAELKTRLEVGGLRKSK